MQEAFATASQHTIPMAVGFPMLILVVAKSQSTPSSESPTVDSHGATHATQGLAMRLRVMRQKKQTGTYFKHMSVIATGAVIGNNGVDGASDVASCCCDYRVPIGEKTGARRASKLTVVS